jgi:hypothetical protein
MLDSHNRTALLLAQRHGLKDVSRDLFKLWLFAAQPEAH